MKKGILTVLVMLLMLAALVTIGSVAADGDEGAPFEIAAKSISTKENLVLNFKVSVPEGADLSTLSLLLWEGIPEDGFTAESETAVSLALAGRESKSGYYVFCYDGIEDKELGREVYVRACYRDGEETIYTETVRYSVAIYLYTMRQTAEGEFLSLLDSLIARGNSARDAALAAGDENVGPALDGMATVTLTDAHFADGSRTGRFLVGQEITAYADNEGTLFWKSGSTTLSDSASDTLTFTVTENASYRPLRYTEGLKFSISNGEATVTDYTGSSTSVVIPKSYNGYPVTSIGEDAFGYCSSLESITIPDSVTSIGSYAFFRCSSLKSVTFGENSQLTSIGERAFCDCSSLDSMTIPESVTSIGDRAFSGCSSLVYNEYDNAYYLGNDSNPYLLLIEAKSADITSCNIHTATKHVYYGAFYGCKSLESITIPERVTTIGNSAFGDCSSLKSITIPESVTSIGDQAFYGCSSLESVTFGENSQLTSIGGYAFVDCWSLTSITIPESVTSIGDSAFYWCSSLTSVTFGENSQLTSIGRDAFYGCWSLECITIPGSVTSIGDSAFKYCSSLTSITIPESVTSIGDSAFEGCSSLVYNEYDTAYYLGNDSNTYLWLIKAKSNEITSCNIHTATKHVYSAAFSDCSSLVYNEYDNAYYLGNDSNPYLLLIKAKSNEITSCNIHTATKHVYSAAFSDCSSLTSITLPESVTSIGDSAFYGCTSLTSVTFGENSQLTSIGDYAFYGCSSLTSITISESVTSIGSYAFRDCSSLESVAFGENSQLTSIGGYAFVYCWSLNSITIPASVTSIGYEAFEGCYKLVEVINHSSLEIVSGDSTHDYVAYYAKEVHTGESKIQNQNGYLFYTYNDIHYLLGYTGEKKELILPDSYLGEAYEIYAYAFYRCSSLTSITIPESVTSIGNYAFYSCSSLEGVTFGENSQLTSIGEDAFGYCSSLTSITIPSSVTTIGNDAFYGCSSLTSITFADPSTWYRATSSDYKNATKTDVTNPYANATYFESTYTDYYWYKE